MKLRYLMRLWMQDNINGHKISQVRYWSISSILILSNTF